MPVNQLLIHDDAYPISKAYKEGAMAMRCGRANNTNPYRRHSQAHEEWDNGHVNESAREHVRFGKDVLVASPIGTVFTMDPEVPRNEAGGIPPEWYQAQRMAIGASKATIVLRNKLRGAHV